MTDPKLPSAEELAEELFPGRGGLPDGRGVAEAVADDWIRPYGRAVLEAAAEKAKWKAKTIGIMQHYQDGEADEAAEEFAIEIRKLIPDLGA